MEKTIEEISMGLIANSGESRTLAFEALDKAEKGDYEEASFLMKKSNDSFVTAHKIQTELLSMEAQNKRIDINVLLVHAQDHLMSSMLARELIEKLINMHEKIDALNN
jgi:PTS system cellobiose-specific IIA component